MDLPYFTNLFPGEPVYSCVSRYAVMLGKNNKEINRELFGRDSCVDVGIRVPGDLEYFCNITGLDFESIINNHTLFNYYAAFLPVDKQIAAKKNIFNGNTKAAIQSLGIKSNVKLYNDVMVCPACINNDVNIYGQPYFHIEHQMNGIILCTFHKEVLIPYEPLFFRVRSSYQTIDVRYINKISAPTQPLDKHVLLANIAHELINSNANELNSDVFQHLYLYWLESYGYITINKRVRIESLTEDIRNYYTDSLLDFLNLSLGNHKSVSWIKKLLNPSNKFNSRPIMHILLITFLAEDFMSFLNGPKTSIKGKSIDNLKNHESFYIENKRRELHELIRINPGLTRYGLSKLDMPLYRYFIKYDRQWFEETILKQYSSHRAKDWEKQDNIYLTKCKIAYRGLIINEDHERITKRLIVNTLGSSSIIKYQHLLPKTITFITSVAESPSEYRLSKYCKLADEFNNKMKRQPYPEEVWRINNCIDRERFLEIRSKLEDYINQKV